MDTGLNTLIAIARFHQLPAEPELIIRQFGKPGQPFSDKELLNAAKALSLKAKRQRPLLNKLDNGALPAIAKLKDGSYVILVRIAKSDPKENAHQPQTRFLLLDLRESGQQELDLEGFNAIWSGEVIILARRGRLGREFDIARFIPAIIKYRKVFAEVLIISLILQLFALVSPLFFQVVVDKVLVHPDLTILDVLAVGLFVLLVVDTLLGGVRNYLFSHTTNRMGVALCSRLYNHLLALPVAYFESRQVGQHVARVRELETLRNFITGTSILLIIDLVFAFVFLAVMWYYSATLTWIVLVSIPLYIMLSVFINPILRHNLNDKSNHGVMNSALLSEAIAGIGTVKSKVLETQVQKKIEDNLASYVRATTRSQHLNTLAIQIAGLINKLVTLGIIWWGANLVIAKELTIGQLVAFNLLAARVNSPILRLVELWQDFQQADISIARLGEILSTPRESGFSSNSSHMPEMKGDVTLEHVHFRYHPDGPLILDDVSLHCRQGEMIGIVGHSGSGKSTIAKLIQRHYRPGSGRILIDGVDLSLSDSTWLRQQIGVVHQDNFLFNSTIRENIALADPELPMQQVKQAAKLAGAHEFIIDLPRGYDTLVSQQGSNLACGQRQRINIAQALVGNPRLLILDEATSSLDNETDQLIQGNIAAIRQGRTLIVLTHRVGFLRQCDRIVVLDKGRIVEQGDHKGLLKKNGYYARLFNCDEPMPVSHQPPEKEDTDMLEISKDGSSVNSRDTTKHKEKNKLGIVSGDTEIEEVDESWAIEMLEALEREELGNENNLT